MGPESFETFFLAAAGTGGAFVGLLFVAISIGPQRTFGDLAGMGAPRQHLAEATFLTLINGFVVSSVALIPGINVGWIALVLGIWGLLWEHGWGKRDGGHGSFWRLRLGDGNGMRSSDDLLEWSLGVRK